jgi:hypothetical protein
MTTTTTLDRHGAATAERLEAEGRLRDAATALLRAVDEYERALGVADAGSGRLSVRGAEMHLEFAERRVRRAAIRARESIRRNG